MLSIVLPAMNEAQNIPLCYEEITAAMQGLDLDYEVLVVDNDSTDDTGRLCEALCREDPRWRYVRFSRNFSAEHSMAAGLRYSRGDAVMILWSDLQDPPSLIPRFVEKWREGFKIVQGVYTEQEGLPWTRRMVGDLFYRLINAMSDIHLEERSADFRLMDRTVVNALNRLRERNRYMRGLAHWVGFPKCEIRYQRRPRRFGTSKMPWANLLPYAMQAIANFSVRPLRLILALGVVTLLGTLGATFGYLGLFIFVGTRAPGILTVVLLLLANMGLTLFGIGIIGEYIGAIYGEAKGRPLWIVEKAVNIDIPDEERYG
jgi:dolichol-phosphate mannosyltransferase